MRPLSARERRLIALGLLVCAVGLIWLAVVQPLVGGFFDRAAERQRLEATLERDQRLLGRLSVWRGEAEAQRATAPRFAILAPSESIAAEALKPRVTHLAAEDGFAVTATEDLLADAAPGTVKLRADMTMNQTQLTDALRRLQSEGAYVVVDYLSVSADRALAAGRSVPMDVRLELSAAFRPSAARKP